MKRVNRKSRAPEVRSTPNELACQRDWYYESLRLVNDQMAALRQAREVPVTYLKQWGRRGRSA